jgi:hypothetical protein
MVDEISRQRDGAEKDARKDEGECPSDGRFRTYGILTPVPWRADGHHLSIWVELSE